MSAAENNNDELLEEIELEAPSVLSEEGQERFESDSWKKRLKRLFKGLSCAHDTREYKEALIEVQRLSAPLLAILLPAVFITVLFVVSAVGGGKKEKIEVEIQQAEKEEEQLEEVEPPPETEPPPEMDNVEVQVDVPTVGTPTEVANNATPTQEPLSPKPAQVDAMMAIQSPVTMRNVMGSSRSTGVRGTMTRGGAMYGDAGTEQAVMKALRWLKYTQGQNGGWGMSAMTSFAVLTYLAHGETPGSKEFGETVRRALDHLIGSIYDDKGVTRLRGADGNEYSFLIAAYALSEVYGMTKNPNAKEAAAKCLTRIVKNQSPTGGWDYKINRASTRDDLSFGGWALQAVKAGKLAGIHVEGMDECIKKAIKYLKTRAFKNGGFGYCAGNGPSGLTATGCLAMQLLGYGKEKQAQAALDYMREWLPGWAPQKGVKGGLPGASPQYYCYYASQCKFQAGMRPDATPADKKSWQVWNTAMKKLYPKDIITLKDKSGNPVTIEGIDGKMKQMGYWKNRDANGSQWPVMSTCLAALQLMVYYRYLPVTTLKVEVEKGAGQDAVKDKRGEIDVSIDI